MAKKFKHVPGIPISKTHRPKGKKRTLKVININRNKKEERLIKSNEWKVLNYPTSKLDELKENTGIQYLTENK